MSQQQQTFTYGKKEHTHHHYHHHHHHYHTITDRLNSCAARSDQESPGISNPSSNSQFIISILFFLKESFNISNTPRIHSILPISHFPRTLFSLTRQHFAASR